LPAGLFLSARLILLFGFDGRAHRLGLSEELFQLAAGQTGDRADRDKRRQLTTLPHSLNGCAINTQQLGQRTGAVELERV
jgi:hypothetical protein